MTGGEARHPNLNLHLNTSSFHHCCDYKYVIDRIRQGNWITRVKTSGAAMCKPARNLSYRSENGLTLPAVDFLEKGRDGRDVIPTILSDPQKRQ